MDKKCIILISCQILYQSINQSMLNYFVVFGIMRISFMTRGHDVLSLTTRNALQTVIDAGEQPTL